MDEDALIAWMDSLGGAYSLDARALVDQAAGDADGDAD